MRKEQKSLAIPTVYSEYSPDVDIKETSLQCSGHASLLKTG